MNYVSSDDIQDVEELSEKIEVFLRETLKGQQLDIALSSLVASAINITIEQSESLEELIDYRNAFFIIFDNAIIEIERNQETF